jgi:hypothetical protein
MLNYDKGLLPGQRMEQFSRGLVAFWPFNRAFQGKDISGYGNHASIHGAKFQPGPTGLPEGALQFYGNAGSYVTTPNAQTLDAGQGQGFALTMFIRTSFKAIFIPFLEWKVEGKGGNQKGVKLCLLMHYLTLRTGGASEMPMFTKLNFQYGAWNFIGVSYNKSSQEVIGVVNERSEVMSATSVPQTSLSMILGKLVLSREESGGTRGPIICSFRGRVSCTMIYETPMSLDDMRKARKVCFKRARMKGEYASKQ